MDLEELGVYQMAMDIGERVWQVVDGWNYFAKDTVGKQLVKAADSMAANLSEGFGRFFFKENRQFCYYARGSLHETRTWLSKARNRNLLSDKECEKLLADLRTIAIKLNNYIKSIGKGADAVREAGEVYGSADLNEMTLAQPANDHE